MSDAAKWPEYLGEWTSPQGERWVLADYHRHETYEAIPVWIFGKYADPMSEEMYSVILDSIVEAEMERAERKRQEEIRRAEIRQQPQNQWLSQQVYRYQCQYCGIFHTGTSAPTMGACNANNNRNHVWHQLEQAGGQTLGGGRVHKYQCQRCGYITTGTSVPTMTSCNANNHRNHIWRQIQ